MAGGKQKAVFLDRDGVLVVPEFRDGRSFAPRRLEDLEFYVDAASAVSDLKAMGFVVVVVTNQPDVGAGLVDRSVVDAMHDRLRAVIAVDDIEVCCDTRETATDRRKPGTGMFVSAADTWNIDPGASYIVGDRASDIEAGVSFGGTTIFIDRGYTAEAKPTAQSATVSELAEAVAWIAEEEKSRGTATRDERTLAAN